MRTVQQRRELEKIQRGSIEFLQMLSDNELLLALSLCRANSWELGLEAGIKELERRNLGEENTLRSDEKR